jgi:CBS domain-containing protein
VTASPAPTSLQQLTVGDLMRPATTTVETDAHLASAAYLMKHAGDTALVVTAADGGSPVAIITDALVSQAVADGRDLEETRINQLGLARPACVDPATPVTDAAERMLADGVEHLPVVDGDRLLGLVDLTAVCRVLLQHVS